MAKAIETLSGDRAAYRLEPKPFGEGGYAFVVRTTVKATAETVERGVDIGAGEEAV